MTSPGQRIKGARDAELRHMDAAFDFEAGLADVSARAGLTRPETTERGSHATTPAHPSALITSFGYLHGPAPDADITVDVRTHLRDPHIDPQVRELTGRDAAVRARVLATPGARCLAEAIAAATRALLHGPGSGQRPVRVAIGCAGGRHRSVVLADHIAARLALTGCDATTEHLHIHHAVVTRRPPHPQD